MTTSCPHEIEVGAFLLDALEPHERLRMDAHVRECPVCAETMEELGALPALLATAPRPDVPLDAPVPSELAFERLRRSAVPVRPDVAVRPARRRHRWLLAVAAAAVLVGGGIVTSVVTTSSSLAIQAESGPVSARASISPEGTGSTITLRLDGIRPGEKCELVAIGRDGQRDTTRSWTVDYHGTAHWTGTVSVAPGELDRLEVVTVDGRTLVTMQA